MNVLVNQMFAEYHPGRNNFYLEDPYSYYIFRLIYQNYLIWKEKMKSVNLKATYIKDHKEISQRKTMLICVGKWKRYKPVEDKLRTLLANWSRGDVILMNNVR